MPTAAALFALNQQRLFQYLCRAVGHSETARDLTQDVFVRVMRHEMPAMDDQQSKAWLFRIARNLAIDHHRRRVRTLEVAVDPAALAKPASQDTRIALNDALSTLSTLDRDIFLLRELGGLSYAEISDVCDLTDDAVRSRVHRARLQLRGHLSASLQERRLRPLVLDGRHHD